MPAIETLANIEEPIVVPATEEPLQAPVIYEPIVEETPRVLEGLDSKPLSFANKWLDR